MHAIRSPTLRRLSQNLAILAGGELVTKAITFVVFVHLARTLEPELYGLLELTMAVMMILSIIVEHGLGIIGTRDIARETGETGTLVGRIVSARLILASVVYLLVAVIVLCLPISKTLTVLLLGYGLSLFGIPFLLNWVFEGRNEMKWVALSKLLRQATFGGIVLLLISTADRVLLLPMAELAAVAIAVIVTIGAYLQFGEKVVVNLRTGCDSRLFRESLPVCISQVIWALRLYLPTILVGVLASQAAVGLFGAAHRIVMAFEILLGVYFINLFPTMSQTSYKSVRDLPSLLNHSMHLVLWPSLVLALCTTFAAPNIIGMIFGEQYMREESIAVLAVLIWIIPISRLASSWPQCLDNFGTPARGVNVLHRRCSAACCSGGPVDL